MTRPTPIPDAPILCENHEDHMARLRSPKDQPPAWLVEQNRDRWVAWIDGHPFTFASGPCPWESAAAVCHQALFWAGVYDTPCPAFILVADDEDEPAHPMKETLFE
jgi:hypothetical protein